MIYRSFTNVLTIAGKWGQNIFNVYEHSFEHIANIKYSKQLRELFIPLIVVNSLYSAVKG